MSTRNLWGGPSVQNHYFRGRKIEDINAEDIEGICRCGYATLRPSVNDETERMNGGLTVNIKKVNIYKENNVIKKASAYPFIPVDNLKINLYHACNACVNNWK